jgi:transcriptional regulator with XRE-family HTH domain
MYTMTREAEGLAARLRRLRTAAKMTQEQLAEAAGLRQSNVTSIERGAILHPRLDTLRALARALKVTTAELIGPDPEDTTDAAP